jgi:hypothetical protein
VYLSYSDEFVKAKFLYDVRAPLADSSELVMCGAFSTNVSITHYFHPPARYERRKLAGCGRRQAMVEAFWVGLEIWGLLGVGDP